MSSCNFMNRFLLCNKCGTYVQYQNDDYVYEREFPYITIEYTDGKDINLLARIYEGLRCSSFPYRYVIHLPHDFDVRIDVIFCKSSNMSYRKGFYSIQYKLLLEKKLIEVISLSKLMNQKKISLYA